MINKIKCIAFSVFMLVMSSCKDGGCNMILNSVVNETLPLKESLEIALPNSWTYTDGGGCGLIVHNNGSMVVAYDRCSPVKNSSYNKVIVDGMQVVDSNTGAKWLLLDGSPIHIAECSLQRYQVKKSGNLYVITN